MGEAQHGLEEPGDAGRALQVTDVGLHRSDGERGAASCGAAEDLAEGGGLHGVAHPGAGAVEFDVADVGGVDPGALVGGAQDGLLGGGVGGGEGGAVAVVVGGAAADDGVHAVAVGEGAAEELEDDDSAALAAYVAVGAGVEGVAGAVRAERPELGGGQAAFGTEVEVHAAGEGEFAVAEAEAVARELDGGQGGGLGAVDGHAGAGGAERVGQAVGDEGPVEPGERVVSGACAGPPYDVGVVADVGAEVDGGGPGGGRGGNAGVLQCLPAQFEGEPGLRVHGVGLAGRDAEERGVEVGGRGEEAAAVGCGAAVRQRPAVGGRAVAAVVGGVGDGAAALGEEVPVGGRAVGSRKPARETDDGHGFVARCDVPEVGGHRLVHRWHSRYRGRGAGAALTFARGQGAFRRRTKRFRGIPRHVGGVAEPGPRGVVGTSRDGAGTWRPACP